MKFVIHQGARGNGKERGEVNSLKKRETQGIGSGGDSTEGPYEGPPESPLGRNSESHGT